MSVLAKEHLTAQVEFLAATMCLALHSYTHTVLSQFGVIITQALANKRLIAKLR